MAHWDEAFIWFFLPSQSCAVCSQTGWAAGVNASGITTQDKLAYICKTRSVIRVSLSAALILICFVCHNLSSLFLFFYATRLNGCNDVSKHYHPQLNTQIISTTWAFWCKSQFIQTLCFALHPPKQLLKDWALHLGNETPLLNVIRRRWWHKRHGPVTRLKVFWFTFFSNMSVQGIVLSLSILFP